MSLLISAGSTRGKTYTTKQIVKDLMKQYKKVYTFVITNYPEEWDDIENVKLVSKEGNIMGKEVKSGRGKTATYEYQPGLFDLIMDPLIQEINKILVCDDWTDAAGQNDLKFTGMLSKCRHNNCFVILMNHQFKKIRYGTRQMFKDIILFGDQSSQYMEDIWDQVAQYFEWKQFRKDDFIKMYKETTGQDENLAPDDPKRQQKFHSWIQFSFPSAYDEKSTINTSQKFDNKNVPFETLKLQIKQ